MGTILQTIADYARLRVVKDKEQVSLDALKKMCSESRLADGKLFEAAIIKPGISFICEVKKASPSKGIIAEDFAHIKIAEEYVQAGADCISCLTEPRWFLGSDDIFKDIRRAVSIPMLRKDFIVDEYQIYQAKVIGANALLLICSILDALTLRQYLELCRGLGLAAIAEAHDEAEISIAINAGATMIGVNNRNLKDFSVNMKNCKKLRSLVPNDILFIAESGIRTPEDIKTLRNMNVDAVLIGETLMRASDKKKILESLRGVT